MIFGCSANTIKYLFMCTARWGKMKQAWQIFDNVDKLYSDLVFKKETSLFKVCLANTFSKKRWIKISFEMTPDYITNIAYCLKNKKTKF